MSPIAIIFLVVVLIFFLYEAISLVATIVKKCKKKKELIAKKTELESNSDSVNTNKEV